MSSILIRTLVIYFFLIFSVQLMGKRQIGELQLSEFVTTLLLSELAAYPVLDSTIPLIYAVIPIVALVTSEVWISYGGMKFAGVKKFFARPPCLLVRDGVIDQKSMKNARIIADELMCEIRLKGFGSLDEVAWVILESNGKMSVLPKPARSPLTPADMGIPANAVQVKYPVVVNGQLNKQLIPLSGRSGEWVLKAACDAGHTSLEGIYLMLAGPGEGVTIIEREGQVCRRVAAAMKNDG